MFMTAMTAILETVLPQIVVAGGTRAVLKENLLVNHMLPQLLTTMLSGLLLIAMRYMKQSWKSDYLTRLRYWIVLALLYFRNN